MNKPEQPPRDDEALFRIMANCAPVMLWMSGTDKQCYFFNEGWLLFTGRSMDEELGNGWAEGVHSDDQQRCLDTYVTAFDGRKPFRMEYRLRRHDGAFRWILDTGTPRYGQDGEFAGYVGSCIDVQDFRDTQERLNCLVADKDALLKELHHRVKNNFQMLLGFITLRLNRIINTEARDELRQIVERITSLALIQEQLSGAETPSKIDFSKFLQELATAISALEDRPEIIMHVDVNTVKLPIERAVPVALIVNELLANCYRHAFPKGRSGEIRLSLTSDQDHESTLTVSDNGIGFSPEGRETSGFGKRIIDMLARQAGVEVKCPPSVGATVIVDLGAAS